MAKKAPAKRPTVAKSKAKTGKVAPKKSRKVLQSVAKVAPKAKKAPKSPRAPRRSNGGVRAGIGMAKGWYIQGIIPAVEGRAEVRNPSLADLAAAVGVHIRTLEHRSTAEGWVALRDEFAARLIESDNARVIKAMGNQHPKARSSYFRASLRALNHIEKRLADPTIILPSEEIRTLTLGLRSAQDATDLAYTGPRPHFPPPAGGTAVQVNFGWPLVSGRMSPELSATMQAIDDAKEVS